MKIKIDKQEKVIFMNDRDLQFLNLNFLITINQKTFHMPFMVFLSFVQPDTLKDLLTQRNTFFIKLEDNGFDIKVEPIENNMLKISLKTYDDYTEECINENELIDLNNNYWIELFNFLLEKIGIEHKELLVEKFKEFKSFNINDLLKKI